MMSATMRATIMTTSEIASTMKKMKNPLASPLKKLPPQYTVTTASGCPGKGKNYTKIVDLSALLPLKDADYFGAR